MSIKKFCWVWSESLHWFQLNLDCSWCFQFHQIWNFNCEAIPGLSFGTDENSLREAFVPYGNVVEARIIFDRESGRSRGFGFGFVSYASAAIQALDGRDLHGRFLRVAHAADQRRTSRDQSFSGAAGYGDSYRSEGYGNRGATYTADNGLNSGPQDSFKTHDISNGANRNYLHNTANNFGDDPVGGYGAAFGGDNYGNGSYGSTGNFSSNGYSNGNADSYNATNGGANIFNDQMPYKYIIVSDKTMVIGNRVNLENNNHLMMRMVQEATWTAMSMPIQGLVNNMKQVLRRPVTGTLDSKDSRVNYRLRQV